MRPNQQLTLLLAFLFSGFVSNAQGIIEEDSDITPVQFNSSSQQLNFYSQQGYESLNSSQIDVINKGVYINQVGDQNRVNTQTQSQITDVALVQLGNYNQIDLDLKATAIDYTVLQQGNNNRLLEYNLFDNKQLIERNIQQTGNNQNLVIHGNNSIVDKMKITMSEGSQSLIIRNTN